MNQAKRIINLLNIFFILLFFNMLACYIECFSVVYEAKTYRDIRQASLIDVMSSFRYNTQVNLGITRTDITLYNYP